MGVHLKIVTLLVFVPLIIFSQAGLISERMAGGKYELTVKENLNLYTVEKSGGKSFINFHIPEDLSRTGEFQIPIRDLFIALPPGSKPQIRLSFNSFEVVNALPKIIGDTLFAGPMQSGKDNNREEAAAAQFMKGFLWIGKNYCAHISLPLVLIESFNRSKVLREFSITIELGESVIAKSGQIAEIDGLILNKQQASNWQAEPVFNYSLQDEWIDYNSVYLKIGTYRDDIYRLTSSDFEMMNINYSTIDPKKFKLFSEGKQVPIHVAGEDDGIFDAADYIEFFGRRKLGGHHRKINETEKPYNEYLGRFSDTTIYWLCWEGAEGVRVKTEQAEARHDIDTAKFFYQTIHYEQNPWFDFSSKSTVEREMPYWKGNKMWGWKSIGTGKNSFQFTAANIYPGEKVFVYAKLQSYATDLSKNSHLAAMGLNNSQLVSDSTYIDKNMQAVLAGVYNSNDLKSGANNFYLYNYPNFSTVNNLYFDWFEIEYPKVIAASNDSLFVTFKPAEKAAHNILVTSINPGEYTIWKCGDESKRFELITASNFAVWSDYYSDSSSYMIKRNSAISRPELYYAKKFLPASASAQQTDYIAITHYTLAPAVDDYLFFVRSHYGLTTTRINVNDIFDQFNYGNPDPSSIREFLKMAADRWPKPAPQYLLLAGAANYDYLGFKKTYLGEPKRNNFVPSFGAPVSDNWYAIWDTTGANLPRMIVGRLPLNNPDELLSYKLRHEKYLARKYDLWNKRFLFFSGGMGNNPDEIDRLKRTNQEVIDQFVLPPPVSGVANHFYKTLNPSTNFGPVTEKVFQSVIDEGGIFISYLGHSGTRIWDNSITEPAQLASKNGTFSLITDFGCSTARFAEPDVISFAQLFLFSPTGTAISYIGNSSLGFSTTSTLAPRIFYKKILSEKILNIGAALVEAKKEMLGLYGTTGVYKLFALTNCIIGDPVISLPLPEKPNLYIDSKKILLPETITNDTDSVGVKIIISNFGVCIPESIDVEMVHSYGGLALPAKIKRLALPVVYDTLFFKLPVFGKGGAHSIKIKLDSSNEVDEIYEDDNQTAVDFFVAGTSLKRDNFYQNELAASSGILLINPSANPGKEEIVFEISRNSKFTQPAQLLVPVDSFYTKILLAGFPFNSRYWYRCKMKDQQAFGLPASFYRIDSAKYILNDSVSFSGSQFNGVKFRAAKVTLDSNSIELKVKSAGWNDGNVAVISKDGVNYLPFTSRGHNVVVLKNKTFEFVNYLVFDLLFGGSAVRNEYVKFIDTLGTDKLVLIAVADEGRVTNAELRSRLKLLGSALIDQLEFRGSWALIGIKGALPGSVPEAVSKPYSGAVVIDTVILRQNSFGEFTSSKIGPSSFWKKLKITGSNAGQIEYKIIGLKENEPADTINYNNDGVEFLNGMGYRYIKLLARFNAVIDSTDPSIKEIAADYLGPPELGINYQAVEAGSDTISQGEKTILNFTVFNAGESAAKDFNIALYLAVPDGSQTEIARFEKITIGPFYKKSFRYEYSPSISIGAGRSLFLISIDPEDKIRELYEENNFYEIPFIVEPDTNRPTLSIRFDNAEIFDGEFVSSSPEIKIELNSDSPLPVADTSVVEIKLDNRRIYFQGGQQQVSYNFAGTNPKMTVLFKPALEDGEHILNVSAKNPANSSIGKTEIKKYFIVSSLPKLLALYNYPNPFKDDTYFTFRLSRIPDELFVKIYTIAGRMIKEIKRKSAELNYDLNTIYWDGKDGDGNLISNGVYFYKIIMKLGNETLSATQKLAKVK